MGATFSGVTECLYDVKKTTKKVSRKIKILCSDIAIKYMCDFQDYVLSLKTFKRTFYVDIGLVIQSETFYV